MKSILLKEIKSFFGSPTGYLVIAVFLLLNGLFLWIFDGQYNILQSGFADLTPFFTIAPWVLIFLIPAVTMRSISDERRQGTLELLVTKPLTLWQITLGKFFGAFLLIDFVTSTIAFSLERRHPANKGDGWLLFHIWLQRFAYRQVFSIVLAKTLKRAIDGKPFNWDKLERTAKMSKQTEALTM